MKDKYKDFDVDSEDNTVLVNLVESHIDDSLGFISTETSLERQRALEYYLREPYGNEVEGRSQIVTGEVAEANELMVQRCVASKGRRSKSLLE